MGDGEGGERKRKGALVGMKIGAGGVAADQRGRWRGRCREERGRAEVVGTVGRSRVERSRFGGGRGGGFGEE